jgi:hypothetical protein
MTVERPQATCVLLFIAVTKVTTLMLLFSIKRRYIYR